MKKISALLLALVLLFSCSLALAENSFKPFQPIILADMDLTPSDYFSTSTYRALYTLLAAVEIDVEYDQYGLDVSQPSYVGLDENNVITLYYDGTRYICAVYMGADPSNLYMMATELNTSAGAKAAMTEMAGSYYENDIDDLAAVAEIVAGALTD
ncbi:MAG: hypothetical protein IJ507_02320 [Clostridia bacterium]|nr:hypothetical protein [Clostridia bacterium]